MSRASTMSDKHIKSLVDAVMSDEHIKSLVDTVIKQCANDDNDDSDDSSPYKSTFNHEFDLNDVVYIPVGPGNVHYGRVNGITFDYFDGVRELTYHVDTRPSRQHSWSCSKDEVFSTANEAMAASHAD